MELTRRAVPGVQRAGSDLSRLLHRRSRPRPLQAPHIYARRRHAVKSGKRGALPRPAPLRTGLAGHPRIRLKQAP